MKRENTHNSKSSNICNSKSSNICNGNGSRNGETAIKTAVANAIDAAASKLTGATTPINLDVNIAVGVKGSVGDIQIALTSENYCTVSNGAYRREAKETAEAERMEAAKKEASRLLDLYSPDVLAEIISRIK